MRTAPTTPVAADPRWARVLARDPRADHEFLYAVRTTGIYCRPSCPARRPLAAHVTFFVSSAAAEQAGFRACRRCRPNQAPDDGADVARICQALEQAEDPPALAALARQAGLSPSQLHRRFRTVTGLSPKTFATACGAERLGRALRSSRSVTEAIYAAGFGSSAAAYRQADRLLGMTPSAVRSGGAATTMQFAAAPCTLGTVLVAQTERGVCAILLGDDASALEGELARRFPRANRLPGGRAMQATLRRVVRLVDEPGQATQLPLDLHGTLFQVRVWQALTRIPAGQTTTYAALAAEIGAPRAARAVARACATNHVAVAVPCHRVIRGDGDLSGYRWGIERKRALLSRERR
jgi:AraC family transcriptional regulator of adaptative response/methylated-DNA-[protein]-cysteine methyltransferase